MAITSGNDHEQGWAAPDFALPDTQGRIWSLGDLRGVRGMALFFICNHCPYVIGIADRLAQTGAQLEKLGYGVAAICSNDAQTYPQDSFENMGLFAEKYGFTFPYLHDEDQSVARAYGAACTPDLYGFDAMLKLRYHGRLDSAGRNPADADTVPELLNAMNTVALTGQGPDVQNPSIGCSIKWRTA
ncbi:Peroxiredoxin [Monaibacterium marinum]|uniref:Peroxiredoxin n=1 Tax=Pontivivens marinum TaxID=1690039 RepID=A0A2C9CQH9_9RHOB|nr:thioredoxin family protein [Monaibacterium marinum]SOH93473.1 Peroxiredoxin [Monaibacterium marinum]